MGDGTEVQDIGLSGRNVADLQAAWAATMDSVKLAIINAGAFCWQMMENNGTDAGPVVTKSNCVRVLRSACQTDSVYQRSVLMYGLACAGDGWDCSELPDFDQDLANFLLIRGPYAWLGYSWKFCSRA